MAAPLALPPCRRHRRHLGPAARGEILDLGFPDRTMTGLRAIIPLGGIVLELVLAGGDKRRCSVASTAATPTGLSGVVQQSLSDKRVLLDKRR